MIAGSFANCRPAVLAEKYGVYLHGGIPNVFVPDSSVSFLLPHNLPDGPLPVPIYHSNVTGTDRSATRLDAARVLRLSIAALSDVLPRARWRR